jgi:hypothetical protein
MFGLSVFFALGNYKLLIDQSNNPPQARQKENIICDVMAKGMAYKKELDL